MEEKILAQGNIGTVGKYMVEFKDGALIATESVSADGISESATITISGKTIIDGIARKIGGPIPATIAEFLETALGMK